MPYPQKQVVDISEWVREAETENVTMYPIGALKKSLWRDKDDGQLFLFKGTWEREKNTYHEKIPHQIWVELIAAYIGRQIGIEVPDTYIGIINNRHAEFSVGVLSKWFCDEKTAQYISGKELLEGKIEHYIESEEKQHYTLPNILESAKDKAVVNAEEYWVRLLLFDCLIANQDRHHENWGVITVKDKCRFSPVFDNGVGLGFRIKEEAFASFDHETHFSRYRHKIQLDKSKKPYVKDIVQYAKQRNFPLLKFINTLDIIKLENDIVISQTQMNPQIEPDYRLSNERMQFIIQFVEHRKDALCRLWKAI